MFSLSPVGPLEFGHDLGVLSDALHVVGVLLSVEGPNLQAGSSDGGPVLLIVAVPEGTILADIGVNGEVILALGQSAGLLQSGILLLVLGL